MSTIERTLSDLPERIQAIVSRNIRSSDDFIAALKTELKPNATIPVLWLVITTGGLLLCSTHRTRGLYRSFHKDAINSIRVEHSHSLPGTRIEIISSELSEPDFNVPLDTTLDTEELKTILETHSFRVI